MRRTLLRIAIFALTFGLGVGISVGWQLYQWSLVPYEVSSVPPWPLASAAVAKVAETDVIMIVGTMHACGPEANYHTMELSDGTALSQSCERFSSPLAAERALKARLRNAEIAERSLDRDEKGRVVGEKILTSGPRVIRFSLNGNSLCVTDAPSLNHLRLYETGALYHGRKNSGND